MTKEELLKLFDENGIVFQIIIMSHFYGIISESARKNAPTARGHHSLKVEAQSWKVR
jgi:hypothetical protein